MRCRCCNKGRALVIIQSVRGQVSLCAVCAKEAAEDPWRTPEARQLILDSVKPS